MHPTKLTRPTTIALRDLPPVWSMLDGLTVTGYEIRNGRLTTAATADDRVQVCGAGSVLATTVHGLLEDPAGWPRCSDGARPSRSTTRSSSSPTPSTLTSTPTCCAARSVIDEPVGRTRRAGAGVIPNGVGAVAGWMVDQALGEPPTRLHPVAWFGRAMGAVERRTYRDSRAAGVVHLAIGVSGAMAVGVVLRRLLGAPTATALACAVAIAGRMLDDEVGAVIELAGAGDLRAARRRLRGLVGRDTDTLDASDIVRAAIESLAENTVDAVTAPLLWATVGGAPAVLAHRAINTLDAMVGHRTTRYTNFGWASARADDAVNWLPARLTALAVVAVRPRHAGAVATVVRRDAPRHPSPNGGVIESAFAAALDIRLGGAEQLRRRRRGPRPARRRSATDPRRRRPRLTPRPPHRHRVRRRVRDVAEHPTPRNWSRS